jgi:alkylation response protein AidB-like acyl-CoA dehydrogenase
MKVTQDAIQVLGGYGYVTDFHPVERTCADTKLSTQI